MSEQIRVKYETAQTYLKHVFYKRIAQGIKEFQLPFEQQQEVSYDLESEPEDGEVATADE